MSTSVRIDIVSDFMCPWCIVGFRRLKLGIDRFGEQLSFDIHWHPFELTPDMPPEGQNLYAWLTQRYGMSPQRVMTSRQELAVLGRQLGFEFNYQQEMRMYNTFNAHQLLYWAGECSTKQTEMKLAIFSAHFTHHRNISDPAILMDIVNQVGLDAEEAGILLEDGRYRKAVRDDQNVWRNRRVQSVPHFVINEKSTIIGANSPVAFVDAIRYHTGIQPQAMG